MSFTMRIYDIESSGIDTDHDQVLEAAMVSLDDKLEIIPNSELVLKVRPRPDVIPKPMASLVHKLSLNELRESGMSEYEFASMFTQYMMQPNSYVSGYNSINFDDEIIRKTLFRQCMDPYGHEWRDGNKRFDVFNLVRMLYAWDPETINFPTDSEGAVSLKLENISKANFIGHENAHNALSDVYATADLIKLIHMTGTPWLQRAMQLSDKKHAERMIQSGKPLFHSAYHYGRDRAYSSLILPLIGDLGNTNKYLGVDLSQDPSEMLKLTADELRYYMFTKRDQLEERMPLISVATVQANKHPALAYVEDVPPSLHSRMKIDIKECMERVRQVQMDKGFRRRLQLAFKYQPDVSKDVYETLYSGGFLDKHNLFCRERLHAIDDQGRVEVSKRDVSSILAAATDDRLIELAIRMQGNNFPHALTNPRDHAKYSEHLRVTLFEGRGDHKYNLDECRAEINKIRMNQILNEKDESILLELEEHIERLATDYVQKQTLPMDLSAPEEPEFERSFGYDHPQYENSVELDSVPGSSARQSTQGYSGPSAPAAMDKSHEARNMHHDSDNMKTPKLKPCPFPVSIRYKNGRKAPGMDKSQDISPTV